MAPALAGNAMIAIIVDFGGVPSMAAKLDYAGPTGFAIALLLWALPAVALEGVTLPDFLELRGQLKAGRFEALESTLQGYQRRFQAGQHSDEVVAAAFQAFASTDRSLEAALDEWLRTRPGSYVAAFARGNYHWRLGWAARGYEWGKDTDRRQFETMTAHFRRAVPDLEHALHLHSRLSAAYALLVNLHMALGERAGMLWVRDRGLVVVPESREIRRRYLYGTLPKWGGSLVEIKRFVRDTMREHARAPQLASLEGYPDYAKADKLKYDGDGQGATAYFDRALSYGEDLWIVFERGRHRFDLGNLGGALADANRLLAELPDGARFLDLRARVYRRMKHPDLALADWDRAIELDPYDTYFLKNRAALHRKEGRFKKAAADLTDALRFGAFDDKLRAQRGSLFLYDMNQAAKAVIEFRLATALAPDKAIHWYNLTGALYRTVNCDFIQTGRRYLELCEGGASCKQNLTQWVRGAIAAEIRHKACPR